LYYYRARYYDQNVGRFVSEDPVRFKGGINFYRYAKNNPTELVDPFGLNPAVPLPWWWWILDNPITIPIVTVGARGAAIIIGIGSAILAPSTAIDDARAIPKPICDKKRVHCTFTGVEITEPSVDPKLKLCSYTCSDGKGRVLTAPIGKPCLPEFELPE
jgi:hypothetical protein